MTGSVEPSAASVKKKQRKKVFWSWRSRKKKVNAVRTHGGPTVSIRLHGVNYDEASDEANRLVLQEGLTLIHPFDDPEVQYSAVALTVEVNVDTQQSVFLLLLVDLT